MLDQPPSPFDVDAPLGEPERVSPRSITLSAGMLVTALLLGVLVLLPVPYAISSPGPTRDVLGAHDGTPLIQIEGAETFDSTGELRLTTVSGTGGPGFPSSAVGVIQGWLSRWAVVQPVELLYPPDRTQDEIDESNTAEMVSSQENAAVAALTELGYEVPATLVVAGAVEGTDAEGKVEEADVIVALDGDRGARLPGADRPAGRGRAGGHRDADRCVGTGRRSTSRSSPGRRTTGAPRSGCSSTRRSTCRWT